MVRAPDFASEQTTGQTPGELFLRTEKTSQCFRNSVKKTGGRSRFDCTNYIAKPDSSVSRTACHNSEAVAMNVAAATYLLQVGEDQTKPMSDIVTFLRSIIPELRKEYDRDVLAAEAEILAFASFSISLGKEISISLSIEIPALINQLIERKNSVRPLAIEYERDLSTQLSQLEEHGRALLEQTADALGKKNPLFAEYEDDVRAIMSEAQDISNKLSEALAELNLSIKQKLNERNLAIEGALIENVAESADLLDASSPDSAVKAMSIEESLRKIEPSDANRTFYSDKLATLAARVLHLVSSHVASLAPATSEASVFFSGTASGLPSASLGFEMTYSGTTHFWLFFKSYNRQGILDQDIRVGRTSYGEDHLELLGRDSNGKLKVTRVGTYTRRSGNRVSISHGGPPLVANGINVLPEESDLSKVDTGPSPGPIEVEVFTDSKPGEAVILTPLDGKQEVLLVSGETKILIGYEDGTFNHQFL